MGHQGIAQLALEPDYRFFVCLQVHRTGTKATGKPADIFSPAAQTGDLIHSSGNQIKSLVGLSGEKINAESVRFAVDSSDPNLGEPSDAEIEEQFEKYKKNISKLSKMMTAYLDTDKLFLYEGKYHKYFKQRTDYNPYEPCAWEYEYYGRVLAALAVSDLILYGKLYEKILG